MLRLRKLVRPARRTRGSSLIESLIALVILALVMVGILQMYSLALLVNKGSEARTVMTYRCQQVVENVRLAYYLQNRAQTAMRTNAGLPLLSPTMTSTTVALPYTAAELAAAPFWGPAGADVMEGDGPFRISVLVENIPANANPPNYTIKVTCLPDTASLRRFFGAGVTAKRIEYVAQVY